MCLLTLFTYSLFQKIMLLELIKKELSEILTLKNLILWDKLSNLLHQSWWVLWYVYLPFTVLIILVIFYLLWKEFNDSTDADFFIMKRIQKRRVLVNSFYLVAGAFFSTFASLLCLFVIYTFGHKFVAWWVYVILVTASFIAGFVVAFMEYCFYWGRLRGFSFSSIGFSWSWKFFAKTVFILLQQLFRLRGIFFSYIFMLASPLYIYYLTFFFFDCFASSPLYDKVVLMILLSFNVLVLFWSLRLNWFSCN